MRGSKNGPEVLIRTRKAPSTDISDITCSEEELGKRSASEQSCCKEKVAQLASSQPHRDTQFGKCLCRKIVSRYVYEKMNVNTQQVLLLRLIFASKMCMAQILT